MVVCGWRVCYCVFVWWSCSCVLFLVCLYVVCFYESLFFQSLFPIPFSIIFHSLARSFVSITFTITFFNHFFRSLFFLSHLFSITFVDHFCRSICSNHFFRACLLVARCFYHFLVDRFFVVAVLFVHDCSYCVFDCLCVFSCIFVFVCS